MIRHAVLLSGEYRTFDQSSLSMKFLEKNNVDIYFSTWDRDGLPTSGLVTQERIIKALNGKNLKNYIIDSPFHTGKKYNSNMIYRWKAGLDLVRLSGIEYSTITLLRPDLWFVREHHSNNINFDNFIDIKKEVLYSPWGNPARKDTAEDIMFTGDKETIYNLFLLNNLSEDWELSDNGDWHKWLYSYIVSKSISIEPFEPRLHVLIRRPTCDENDLSTSGILYNQRAWNFNLIRKQIEEYGVEAVKEIWHPSILNQLEDFEKQHLER